MRPGQVTDQVRILLKPATDNAAITATRYAPKGARQNAEGRHRLRTTYCVEKLFGGGLRM